MTTGAMLPVEKAKEYGLIDEIVHEVDKAKLIFEAPKKHQQVWFIEQLGPQVNLGNVLPQDALSLETLRLGLRADTIDIADA